MSRSDEFPVHTEPSCPRSSRASLSAIAFACDAMGQKSVVAYADPEADEIGTVYQACNWLYLGQSGTRLLNGEPRPREYFRERATGNELSERGFRHRGLTIAEVESGEWARVFKAPKHKYLWFADKRRRRREIGLPYPKRNIVVTA